MARRRRIGAMPRARHVGKVERLARALLPMGADNRRLDPERDLRRGRDRTDQKRLNAEESGPGK